MILVLIYCKKQIDWNMFYYFVQYVSRFTEYESKQNKLGTWQFYQLRPSLKQIGLDGRFYFNKYTLF